MERLRDPLPLPLQKQQEEREDGLPGKSWHQMLGARRCGGRPRTVQGIMRSHSGTLANPPQRDQASDILFPYRSPSPRPHPDPTQHTTQHPETDPTWTRNGPERTQMDPKRPKKDPKLTEIKVSGEGRPGGLSGWRGWGCKAKRKSLDQVVFW